MHVCVSKLVKSYVPVIIFELKLNNKHWPVIKPFLIYLKYIKNDQYTGITMDQDVINKLRKI